MIELSRLERLPTELRWRIYQYCLGHEYCLENRAVRKAEISGIQSFCRCKAPLLKILGESQDPVLTQRYVFEVSIFRLNRRLGEEALDFFRENNRFVHFRCTLSRRSLPTDMLF